jgi:hypothetical protein
MSCPGRCQWRARAPWLLASVVLVAGLNVLADSSERTMIAGVARENKWAGGQRAGGLNPASRLRARPFSTLPAPSRALCPAEKRPAATAFSLGRGAGGSRGPRPGGRGSPAGGGGMGWGQRGGGGAGAGPGPGTRNGGVAREQRARRAARLRPRSGPACAAAVQAAAPRPCLGRAPPRARRRRGRAPAHQPPAVAPATPPRTRTAPHRAGRRASRAGPAAQARPVRSTPRPMAGTDRFVVSSGHGPAPRCRSGRRPWQHVQRWRGRAARRGRGLGEGGALASSGQPPPSALRSQGCIGGRGAQAAQPKTPTLVDSRALQAPPHLPPRRRASASKNARRPPGAAPAAAPHAAATARLPPGAAAAAPGGASRASSMSATASAPHDADTARRSSESVTSSVKAGTWWRRSIRSGGRAGGAGAAGTASAAGAAARSHRAPAEPGAAQPVCRAPSCQSATRARAPDCPSAAAALPAPRPTCLPAAYVASMVMPPDCHCGAQREGGRRGSAHGPLPPIGRRPPLPPKIVLRRRAAPARAASPLPAPSPARLPTLARLAGRSPPGGSHCPFASSARTAARSCWSTDSTSESSPAGSGTLHVAPPTTAGSAGSSGALRRGAGVGLGWGAGVEGAFPSSVRLKLLAPGGAGRL